MTSTTPLPPSQPAEEPALTTCGGKIDRPSQYPSADYRGKRVYFCNEACRQAFYQSPDAFMAGEIEHPA